MGDWPDEGPGAQAGGEPPLGRPRMKNQSVRVCGRHFYSEVLWCGNQSICVWEAWGAAQKVLLQPKLGEEGVYARERVVVQMEEWLQIGKYIRNNGSQVFHGYRSEL